MTSNLVLSLKTKVAGLSGTKVPSQENGAATPCIAGCKFASVVRVFLLMVADVLVGDLAAAISFTTLVLAPLPPRPVAEIREPILAGGFALPRVRHRMVMVAADRVNRPGPHGGRINALL